MPGKLRIADRSARSSDRRRNMASKVSLRRTMISIGEAMLASCGGTFTAAGPAFGSARTGVDATACVAEGLAPCRVITIETTMTANATTSSAMRRSAGIASAGAFGVSAPGRPALFGFFLSVWILRRTHHPTDQRCRLAACCMRVNASAAPRGESIRDASCQRSGVTCLARRDRRRSRSCGASSPTDH